MNSREGRTKKVKVDKMKLLILLPIMMNTKNSYLNVLVFFSPLLEHAQKVYMGSEFSLNYCRQFLSQSD